MEPVFIVGQYKCGTSWILQVLSAHPQVIGVAEIDIIRAAYRFEGTTAHLAPLEDRLHGFFDRSGWGSVYDSRENRWRGADILAQLERGENVTSVAGDRSRPRRCNNLSSDALATLYRRVKEAERPEDALDAFLEAVSTEVRDETHVVLKAADQIARFDVLQAWQPGAKKIVITRDGRDAAISGLHFRRLMKELDAPFRSQQETDYWRLLKAWANRAGMVAERARGGELRVVRYEDLTRDFSGTLKPLLAWLQLDASDSVIEAINAKTSFEATTGRARGTAGKGTKRKGAVGEWLDVLSPEEKEQAWSIAGEQLSAFGYTRDGQELRIIQQYQQLIPQFLQAAAHVLTPSSTVLVAAAGGEDVLPELPDRQAWPFPRGANGGHADSTPVDDAAITSHLEDLRAKGADFLLVPRTASWWLEDFREFKQHLDANYRRIWDDEIAVVYQLRERAGE